MHGCCMQTCGFVTLVTRVHVSMRVVGMPCIQLHMIMQFSIHETTAINLNMALAERMRIAYHMCAARS